MIVTSTDSLWYYVLDVAMQECTIFELIPVAGLFFCLFVFVLSFDHDLNNAQLAISACLQCISW